MAFTQLKTVSGSRIRIDLAKVQAFQELSAGTSILLADGSSVEVQESYQTVSNRAKGVAETAE